MIEHNAFQGAAQPSAESLTVTTQKASQIKREKARKACAFSCL